MKKYYLLFLINLLLITSFSVQGTPLAKDYIVANIIENIEFKKIDDSGQIVIKLSSINTPFEIYSPKQGQIDITFPNALIANKELAINWDVVDFATGVKTIKTIPEKFSTLITIQVEKDFHYYYYQINDELTIIPLSRNKITRDQVGLNINQQIDLATLLKKLFDYQPLILTRTFSNKNLSIKAHTALSYPLKAVLNKYNLEQKQIDDNIFIGSKGTLQTILRFKEKKFPIKYIEAYQLLHLYKKIHPLDVNYIRVTPYNNTIIAALPKEQLISLQKFIKQYDRPIEQIQLKSYIIETTLDILKELQTNQTWQTNLPELLQQYSKINKLKIIAAPKVTTYSKEKAAIMKDNFIGCDECFSEEYNKLLSEYINRDKLFALKITPKLLNKQQVELIIHSSISYKTNAAQRELKEKNTRKVTTLNKFLIVYDFIDLEKNINNKITVVFIKPTIFIEKYN